MGGTRPPTPDEWEKYEFHHRARLAIKEVSYLGWFLLAIEIFAIWLVISGLINLVFYKDKVFILIFKIKNKRFS